MDHKVKKIIISGMLVGNNFSGIAPLYIQASTTEESSEVTLVEENETIEESSEVTLVEENETTEQNTESVLVEENEAKEENAESLLVEENEAKEETSEVELVEENKSGQENTISTSVKEAQSNTPIAEVYTYTSQGESYNQQFQVDNSMISLSNNGGNYGQSFLTNVLDGDFQTHWEAKTGNSESFKNEIIFTFSETVTLDKIVYGARQATHKGRGFAKSFEIYASRTDSENDFELVATGTSDLVQEIVQIKFPATEFKRLKFKFIETHNHSLATACEFMFFKTDTVANEVNDIFVDSTYYELKEEYASIEKINELKNNIKNHPLESQFTEILNIAEKSLTSQLPSGVTANMQVSQISKSDNIDEYNAAYKVATSKINNVTSNGGHYGSSYVTNVYDENKSTHWETNTVNSDTFKNELTFSFKNIEEISRIIITPRQHQNGKGFPLKYEIYGTLNENTDEYRLIAQGSFSQVTTDDVEITIPTTSFKKLKFRFVEADQSRPSLGEVSFYYEDKINDQIQTMFKDNLYTELSDQFNTMDEIEVLEQALLNYPLGEDYKTLITIAKDIIQNTNTLFTTEIYTLSQRGNENTQKSQRRQIFAGGNVDPTGYYVMPGETIEIYVDADENSVLPLVTFSQVGQVDGTPSNHRQSLKVGRNIITAPSTGTYGYAVYFTNRALPEEQAYAPRTRIVSDKLQAYPLYIHGKTDPQQFIEQVKNHTGADMAEVMGERFLLSSRNSEAKIAYIDNGKSPLDAVDSMEKIIAAFDKLSGYDPNDPNPVHHPTNALYHYKATNASGLYANNEFIHYSLSSARNLFAGNTSDWGIGHEFGHQIENSDMRLLEVTNNLYSIVAQKAVYGEVLRSFSWNQGNIDNYFTFTGTKGFGGFGETYELTFGLFERLSVIQQVLNYFGDEAYANAARLVRENPSLYNSTGDHQTLITAMSAATGYDLSSHFEYFNYPVTDATKEFTSQFLPLDKKIRYTIMDTYKYIENNIETFNDETEAVITSITREADGFTLNFGTSDNNQGTIAYEIYRDGEMVGFTRTGTFKDTVDPNQDYDYQIVAFDYRVNECRSEVVRPHLPTIEGVEDITLNIRDIKTFDNMLGISATNMIGSNLNVEVQETTIEAPQPGTEAIYTLTYSVTDEAGQTVTKERKVTVTNYLPTIQGIDNVTIKAGDTFEKLAGVTANDTEDGEIKQIEVDGEVKTTEVGTYILTYKVTDKDGNTTTVERTITVRSNDKPTIEGIADLTIKVGDAFEKLAGVTAKDTEDGEIKQIVVTGDVDTTQVGKYTLTYEVTDQDGNTTIEQRTITVRSNDKPTIEGIADVTIKVGDTFDALAGVTAQDTEDGEIKQIEVDGEVKTTEVGKYILTYKVTDKDGNTATVERTITVRSNDKPTIDGIADVTIKVGDTFDTLVGVTAKDTEDGVIKQIEVDGEVKTTEVGTYILTYTVTDQDGNTTTVERTITVRSNDKPMIEGIDNVTIKVGDTFDALAEVTAKDTEDGVIKDIKVTGDVDTTQVGKYTLTYEVTDQDGNKTTIERTITVRSNEKPTIKGIADVTIKVGDTFDALSGVIAKDTEDGVIKDIKVTGDVDTTQVGEYTLTYEVTDQDGNTTKIERTITVRSNDKPTIEGIADVTIKVGDTFDALAGVIAKDTEDGEITNIVVTGDVDTTQVGKYTLTYEVADQDGNTTVIERTITVRSNEKPTIEGIADVAIKVGDTFDALEGVTAKDTEDGEIKQIVVKGDVDTTQVGKYTLTYEVTDQDGNTTTVERTVTVKNIDESQEGFNPSIDNDSNNTDGSVDKPNNELDEEVNQNNSTNNNNQSNSPTTGVSGVLGGFGLLTMFTGFTQIFNKKKNKK